MSESLTDTTGLTHQYSTQVAADLETNLKEQERINEDIAALQQQLATLQQDHSVLVNIQQALGVTRTTKESAPSAKTATVPSARQKAKTAPRSKQTAQKTTAQKTTARKTTTAQERTTARKSSAKSETKTAQPTLVELIRHHLTEQAEPRSAAEISTALGQAHPERDIKTKVVRVTLEGLVARSQAQRTKQGSSVFYTAPETEATPPTEAQPEDTKS